VEEITKEKELELWQNTLKRYEEILSVLGELDIALTAEGSEELKISSCSFCDYIVDINENCGDGQCPFEKGFKCCEDKGSEYKNMRNKFEDFYDVVESMVDNISGFIINIENEIINDSNKIEQN
jgi:hypothetical protein